MFPLSLGAQIYYAEGVDKLASNMVEVRPTIMTAVPRLYETMHGRITRGVAQQGGFKAKLFAKAVELGARRVRGDRALSPVEKVIDMVLDRLVRTKVKQRFGGRLKALVSGGAPLNYDIGVFFTALGLRLLQGYGQTESAPIVSCNLPNKVRIETVGPPMVDVEVRIADDGEILVPRRAGDEGLLGRREGDRRDHPRRLAAYRRYRRDRSGQPYTDHRSQEGHHRELRRRQRLAAAGRRVPYPCNRRSPRRWSTAIASRIWWPWWSRTRSSPATGRRRPARRPC